MNLKKITSRRRRLLRNQI